jgi:hypothetical protein
MGKLKINQSGKFKFTFRFSLDDGINFKYGDLNGVGIDQIPEPQQMGTVTVSQ